MVVVKVRTFFNKPCYLLLMTEDAKIQTEDLVTSTGHHDLCWRPKARWMSGTGYTHAVPEEAA